MNAPTIGPSRNRVDGRLKVTGAAKYAVEFAMPNCLQAWPVESNIAKGRITAIETKAAEAVPGVRAVLTHLNAPKLNNPISKEERTDGSGGIRNEQRFPLADPEVHYAGQYVALVIADTFEQARHAANLVGVTYAPETPVLTMAAAERNAEKPRKNKEEPLQVNKGNVEAAFTNYDLAWQEAIYTTPTEAHNPIEMSGTIAVWEAEDRLTVFDSTQFVKGVQDVLARAFGLERESVRVISPFVGGAFGCKGAVWPHVLLAAMAAKATGAPVKFHVPRKHMFTGTGHRTPTRQHLWLLASKDGKLQAMQHFTHTQTSTVGDFTESCGVRSTGLLYECPSIKIEERIFPVNIATPTFMRAPGECPGTFALESAMDELAYLLKMDPVELRIINDAANHPTKDVPFSAKFLKEAYARGAEKFGWAKRDPKPGSTRDGDVLVGWGMATCTYPAHKMSAAAKVQFRADGTATVQCATHDLGTGAYTAFTQISSEQLGIPFENVTFELGKSDFPFGPVAGGSNSTGTVGTAIHEVAKMFHRRLGEIVVKDAQSPLHDAALDDISMVTPGRIGLTSDGAKSDSFVDILKRAGRESLEVQSEFTAADKNKDLAFQSFGAHFCEVRIDPMLPRVQVSRVVTVINGGRIVNGKTARSQIIGGVVMGIGMALMEETAYDHVTGFPLTRNLADYHVPVNADIPEIDVEFIGEPDFAFNPIGARGLGEIGITGIAAAIANAVYHATGVRVRDLPITPDKLLYMREPTKPA